MPGKLGQPVQILERRGEALEIAGLQERAQAEFDAGRLAHGIVPGAALRKSGSHLVGGLDIPRPSLSMAFAETALTDLTRSPTP